MQRASKGSMAPAAREERAGPRLVYGAFAILLLLATAGVAYAFSRRKATAASGPATARSSSPSDIVRQMRALTERDQHWLLANASWAKAEQTWASLSDR